MRFLFVCVGNSCRSQMAETFARHHGLEADSAGTEPEKSVDRTAISVMAEKGIEMSDNRPKPVNFETLESYDKVISMGCEVEESSPTLKTDEDWGLQDPIGQPHAIFREVRDEIERRVLLLKKA